MNFDNEIWRPVPGHPRHEASSLGRIRRIRGPKIVNAQLVGSGYLRVYMSKSSPRALAHRVVAEAFLGPCQEGQQVNHIDGVKTNNAPANLEYVTISENLRHSYRLGLRKAIRGEAHVKCRFGEDKIRLAHALVANGETILDASRSTGVGRCTLTLVCQGRRWKHLGLSILRPYCPRKKQGEVA